MNHRACMLLLLIASLAARAPGSAAAAAAAAAADKPRRPATTQASTSPAADDALNRLLDANLELSTAPTSAAPRFAFVLVMSAVEDHWLGTAFDAIVQRDGERAAYLFRYGDGLPYLFVGNGISLWHDPAHPGELRMLEGVHPGLLLRAEEAGIKFHMGAAPDHARARAGILVDVASLLADETKFIGRDYDPVRPRLEVRHHESIASVLLADAAGGGGYPVREYRWVKKGGPIIAIEDIRVGADAPATLLAVTRDVVMASGMPVRIVAAPDADTNGKFPLTGSAPAADAGLLRRFRELFRQR